MKKNKITILKNNNVAIFHITNKRSGKTADVIIDIDDVNMINKYKWHISEKGYIRAMINKKNVRLHRFIFNANSKDIIIDHINGNKLDNKKENLRSVTSSQSIMNSKIRFDNKSGARGVFKRQNGRFAVRIQVDGNRIQIGTFDNFKDAVRARKLEEEKLFGEYSFLNSRKAG